jgi:hypothetical protein
MQIFHTSTRGIALPPRQHFRGEKEEGFDETEQTVNSDPDKPEWQHQEPDKGIENKRKDCQRPAEN